MDTPPKHRGPIGWLAQRSRRFQIATAITLLLIVLYPLAYGPWIWIRTGWYREGPTGRVSYVHPIWEPLYFFERHVAQFPEPMWGDYQRWWMQPRRSQLTPANPPAALPTDTTL